MCFDILSLVFEKIGVKGWNSAEFLKYFVKVLVMCSFWCIVISTHGRFCVLVSITGIHVGRHRTVGTQTGAVAVRAWSNH